MAKKKDDICGEPVPIGATVSFDEPAKDKEESRPLAPGVQKFMNDLPDNERYFALRAVLIRSFFESLIQTGFTQEQALEIVKVTDL